MRVVIAGAGIGGVPPGLSLHAGGGGGGVPEGGRGGKAPGGGANPSPPGGGGGPPIWNRRVLWRGVTEADPYLGGATMVMAGHQDQKFVCYPIDPAAAARGRSLVNWIAELRFPEAAEWRREDWNRAGRLDDFLPRFESWDFGWLDVPAVIRGAGQVFEYPMVDRDPL